MNPFDLIAIIIILLVSLSVHEAAHAYSSYRLGDPTPKIQGRLTLNPLAHLDPLGTAVFILSSFAGRGFGWGKPVEINPHYYKHPLRDELLVALAGPVSNIVLALIGLMIVQGYTVGFLNTDAIIVFFEGGDIFVNFWIQRATINCGLAVFNMLPIPPLDGYRILGYLFPSFSIWAKLYVAYNPIISLLVIYLIIGTPAVRAIISSGIDQVLGVLYIIVSTIISP